MESIVFNDRFAKHLDVLTGLFALGDMGSKSSIYSGTFVRLEGVSSFVDGAGLSAIELISLDGGAPLGFVETGFLLLSVIR